VRVVFLDRDGVINRNRDDYVKSVDEFEFLPGAPEAFARLSGAGWRAVVVSNQACIGKGLVAWETVAEIERVMLTGVAAAGGEIAAVYYCPHKPEDGCGCRKPAPGLILQASRDMSVDPKEAVFVGDAAGDVLAGRAAGCKTVVVLTGRISAAEAAALDPAPDFIAADLAQAAEWIIAGGA
jgi:histidinol-phosphate phosphatase family protein